MTPFNLKIITPDGVFFPKKLSDGTEQKVVNIIVRTTVGDKGILAKHEPYVAALPIGKVRVQDVNGKYRVAAISNGTIRVEEGGDTVILVQSCEWSNRIDVARAEEAKKKAGERLSNPDTSILEHDIAEFKLKRALNRIDAANPE